MNQCVCQRIGTTLLTLSAGRESKGWLVFFFYWNISTMLRKEKEGEE